MRNTYYEIMIRLFLKTVGSFQIDMITGLFRAEHTVISVF